MESLLALPLMTGMIPVANTTKKRQQNENTFGPKHNANSPNTPMCFRISIATRETRPCYALHGRKPECIT